MTNLGLLMDEVPLDVMEEYLMEKELSRPCPECGGRLGRHASQTCPERDEDEGGPRE